MTLVPPFSYYGSKRRIAKELWDRFGDVHCFTDPFCGSLSVLLQRPDAHLLHGRFETVGDLDTYICHFWRSMKWSPAETAEWAMYPVSRFDIVCRHKFLVRERQRVFNAMSADPFWHDPKLAGIWVWGQNLLMGGSWCHPKKSPTNKYPYQKTLDGYRAFKPADVVKYFRDIQERLANVQIVAGDWTTILSVAKAAISKGNMDGTGSLKGLLLDPPYTTRSGVRRGLYVCDSGTVADYCYRLALLLGSDPSWRIALCGMAGEYDMPGDWEELSWSNTGGRKRRHDERIWFSPHCLKPQSWKAA